MTETRRTMWFFLGMLFALFLGMAGGTVVIAIVAASIGLVWLVGEGLDAEPGSPGSISAAALDRLERLQSPDRN